VSKGEHLRLSELLARFDVRVRNHRTVRMISDELRAAGLDTVPSFATCGLLTELLVVAAEQTDPTDGDEVEEPETGTLPQQSFKICDIPSASGGVDSVHSNAPLSQAVHIMRKKGYSQLPVIDGTSDLKGVVTWSAIAAQYELNKQPTLASAMVRDDLPVAEVHQELFPRLPTVAKHGYLLVRSNSGVIQGIITGADITGRFHTIAQPFFLVGEIEFRLRQCLGPKLGGDPVRAVQRHRKTGNVSDLMFGGYVLLLDGDQHNSGLRQRADNNWSALGWAGVNREQFVHDLKQVKSIRNQIAHFDDEQLSAEQLNLLAEFSGLLKQLL
jgi:CBS domain-containing protein